MTPHLEGWLAATDGTSAKHRLDLSYKNVHMPPHPASQPAAICSAHHIISCSLGPHNRRRRRGLAPVPRKHQRMDAYRVGAPCSSMMCKQCVRIPLLSRR